MARLSMRVLLVVWCVLTPFLYGCSTTQVREAADREVYKAIAEKTPAVPGMDPAFTIDPGEAASLEGLPSVTEEYDFLGVAKGSEVGAKVVSLEKALELAVKHNRSYQNTKESLYLQALSLTLDRHNYTPIFSGSAGASYNRTTRDVRVVSPLGQAITGAPGIIREIGDLTGTPADLLIAYANLVNEAADISGVTDPRTKVVDERSVEGNTALGVDLLLKGGGKIAIDLTSNFLRFITGDPRVSTSSALVGSFTQPLLRGAGRKIAAEQLTQAERDLLYGLRSFARYRQEFTVKVCSSYYGVLQDRDAARNNWRSYTSFVKNAERERAFAAEGQRTQAELGRLEQAELDNEGRWIDSIRRYKQSLDQFKIELGLSTDAPIVLDDKELESLKQRGIIHPSIGDEDATKVALSARLDLYTQRDSLEDSERKVKLAQNALKPGLDLFIQANVPSMPGDRFQELDFERTRIGGGLNLDPDFNRKSERNAYRAALISNERAKRDLELAEDNIKLEVRDAWRTLDQAKRAYEIALKAVELNRRRVEEQDLLAELGRATAQNRVDTQNDLNASENSLTAALVGHTIARLQFWRDMGILFIKENGQWEEVTDVQAGKQ